MPPYPALAVSAQMTMKEYRKEYREKQKESMKPANWPLVRKHLRKVHDVIVKPRSIDMKEFSGSEEEMRSSVECLYANDGRAFDPTMKYPPSMIDNYGKDYALNARGIYYFNNYRPELVTVDRKVWVPCFDDIDWDDPSEKERRKQARIIMEHNIDNETRNKSEYAWEADAWADVFNQIRNDPCLEVDKHDYFTEMPKTHPVLCTLTGESSVVNRIPDATFGLATYSDSSGHFLVQADELSRERLERLLLHRKCGLLGDPKWGETDLVFPFAVYEAKSWSGDCREARRQACQAGACYLDMLDNLAHKPGPVVSVKAYQTETSHQYQVFALTSFGSHWHLLVGYQRPRQDDEYAGMEGMSKTVYIFQRVWSARVTSERTAWELLSLINQIHLWAITEFRSFVTKHLKPWHKFCDDNYLWDWNSAYDVEPELKRMRSCSDSTDLLLPCWAKLLNDLVQRKVQAKVQKSLAEALEKQHRRKGKGRCETHSELYCKLGLRPNSLETYTSEAILAHLRDLHDRPEDYLTLIKRCLDKWGDIDSEEMLHEEPEDNERGIFASYDKRSFVEEDKLDTGPLDSSSKCSPGPSKRVKVA